MTEGQEAERSVRRLVRSGAGLSWGRDHDVAEEQRLWRPEKAVVNTLRIKPAQVQELVPRGSLAFWTPIEKLILLKGGYLLNSWFIWLIEDILKGQRMEKGGRVNTDSMLDRLTHWILTVNLRGIDYPHLTSKRLSLHLFAWNHTASRWWS